jgi:hypothetical protein
MGCGCPDDKKPFTEYSLAKAGSSIIKHYTDPTYDAFVDDEVKMERLKKCEDCDQLGSVLGVKRCNVCWCFVNAKASLVDQDCPHPNGSRWQKNQ